MLKNLMINKDLHARLKRLVSLMQAENPDRKVTIQGFVEEALDRAIRTEYQSLEIGVKVKHKFTAEEMKF